MRMRRKNNLDSRMNACKDYWISTEGEELNNNEAVKNPVYIDYESVFNNNNPLELDIGCGMGQFVCENALKRQDTNFIAIERINNVLVTACERVKAEKLKNVIFINTNAACLPRYIKPHSVSRIYLNFSNPLPKKADLRQRLTNGRFLNIYRELLTENGEIQMKTDNMHFFEYTIEELSKNGFLLKNVSLDLHNSGITDNIITEHEKKFSDKGMPIYRLVAYFKE